MNDAPVMSWTPWGCAKSSRADLCLSDGLFLMQVRTYQSLCMLGLWRSHDEALGYACSLSLYPRGLGCQACQDAKVPSDWPPGPLTLARSTSFRLATVRFHRRSKSKDAKQTNRLDVAFRPITAWQLKLAAFTQRQK